MFFVQPAISRAKQISFLLLLLLHSNAFRYMFWLWLCFESPRKHPAISIPELKYIEKSLGESANQTTMPSLKTTPWRDMMRSMPVYAIIVANFCRSWNFYLLVLFQSSFLKHKFGFKVEEAGFVGSLPHLIMTTIVPFGGMLADHLRKSGIMSTTNVRKLFNCGGFGMEGVFFLFVAHAKTSASLIISSGDKKKFCKIIC